jgi:hypothetical protein
MAYSFFGSDCRFDSNSFWMRSRSTAVSRGSASRAAYSLASRAYAALLSRTKIPSAKRW